MREERRLRVLCGGELLLRPLEAELGEREPERRIGGVEHRARRGELVGEILPHARLLRSLSREEQHDVHAAGGAQSRTTIDAHVKPAPNAAKSTVDPSPTRPASIASSSATGIVADEVLP